MKNFLVLDFHDNDYGSAVELGMKRLYEYVKENNWMLSPEQLVDVFHKLHEHEALLPLINRAVDAEQIYWDVEHATRGLSYDYDYPVDWDSHKLKLITSYDSITDHYLIIDIWFSDSLPEEWENGERFIFNLLTGENCFK